MAEVEIDNKILREVVDQTAKMFTVVRFEGDDDSTVFMTDVDKVLFLQGKFKKPMPELNGVFGINDFAMFNGLLRFASYNTDEAKISVTRQTKTIGSKVIPETVTEFKFRDANGKGANFRTQSPNTKEIDDLGTEEPQVPWDVSFVPSKSKIQEFVELSKLFSQPVISVYTEDDDLVVGFGEDTDSTHYATMVLEENVTGTLKKINYDTQKFIAILRAIGSMTAEIKLTNRRIVAVFAESDNVEYKYFLRTNV